MPVQRYFAILLYSVFALTSAKPNIPKIPVHAAAGKSCYDTNQFVTPVNYIMALSRQRKNVFIPIVLDLRPNCTCSSGTISRTIVGVAR